MNFLAAWLNRKSKPVEGADAEQQQPEPQPELQPEPVMWHCGNCLYWQSEDENKGSCRFHAPFPEDGGVVAVWPRTQPTDWCGDWAGLPGVVAMERK